MTVTPLYAGLLAIWFLVLSIRVIQRRGSAKIDLGDGGDALMQRRIRGHGNFAEYVPLVLLLMALLELRHASIYLLHGLGVALLVARVLHGISLSYTQAWVPGRFAGTLLTFIVLAVAGIACAVIGLQGMAVAAQ